MSVNNGSSVDVNVLYSRRIPLYRFNFHEYKFEVVKPPVTNFVTDTLTFFTLNLWFDNFAMEMRTNAVIEYIKQSQPHIICFQEVTTTSLSFLTMNDYLRENYLFTDIDGSTFRGYGVIMLTKVPFFTLEILTLPTNMNRSYLSGLFQIQNEIFAVGTVHLESLENRETRREQLRLIHSYLSPYPHKLFMGDFNFDDELNWNPNDKREVEDVWLQSYFSEYIDVWSFLNPGAPLSTGKTFDTSQNVMLHGMSKEIMRYDRVVLSSTGKGDWTPCSFEIVGKTPIGSVGKVQVTLSDHFGIFTSFRYET